ncbi:hypothetical protein CYMTET_2877 [Cymbomonas tetramitiformis]|uniref:Uncharacterized protein n=1 Tax=Cymbomonas tetramitiformis TaxID=36881 RepID=A0AAE0H4F4_9CHLO|nr:hypothetical protein CYMTET_2877 [Cymbomonas tetramitiformis]
MNAIVPRSGAAKKLDYGVAMETAFKNSNLLAMFKICCMFTKAHHDLRVYWSQVANETILQNALVAQKNYLQFVLDEILHQRDLTKISEANKFKELEDSMRKRTFAAIEMMLQVPMKSSCHYDLMRVNEDLKKCREELANLHKEAGCGERFESDYRIKSDIQRQTNLLVFNELNDARVDVFMEVIKLIAYFVAMTMIAIKTTPLFYTKDTVNYIEDLFSRHILSMLRDDEEFNKREWHYFWMTADSKYRGQFNTHLKNVQNVYTKWWEIIFESSEHVWYIAFASVVSRYLEECAVAARENRTIEDRDMLVSICEELLTVFYSVSVPSMFKKWIAADPTGKQRRLINASMSKAALENIKIETTLIDAI